MTRTLQYLIGCLLVTGLSGVGRSAFAEGTDQRTSSRARANNVVISMLVEHATEQSKTFRGLVETINASDGIVFIEEGTCGHGMRACFATVTMAGRHRMLWVKLDTRGTDCDLMGLIGHELRHTVEVLGDPTVTSPIAMYFLDSQVADQRRPPFETVAATKAGEMVRDEIRRTNRCTRVR